MPERTVTVIAAQDLRSYQFKPITMRGRPSTNGPESVGVLTNKPRRGEPATLVMYGDVKMIVGTERVDAGDLLTVTTDGTVVPTDGSEGSVGRAKTGGSIGTVIRVICNFIHGGAGSGEDDQPDVQWKTSIPPIVFQAGLAGSYAFSQAIDNYDEDTTAVFPTRHWFRCAQLAGLNMATCLIGVAPTAERTQISCDTSSVTGSMLVDFELDEYVPYVPSVTGKGMLNVNGRDVNVSYDTYTPARVFKTRVYEPGVGSGPFRVLQFAPGKGGGRTNYQPIAEICNDMNIAMLISDYPDTNVALGGEGEGFVSQTRALQHKEFITVKGEVAVGWNFTLAWAMAGHSGGCNTVNLNLGLKHENISTGEPQVLSTITAHGNKPKVAFLNSSQAIDNTTTPYEDSYTTMDTAVPKICFTGEYDPDRKFNTIEPRRKEYDDVPGRAILRYALYAYHAFGGYTGDYRLDTQHVRDWLVLEYVRNVFKAGLDAYIYNQQEGLDYILNNEFRPAQIISTSEDHGY